MSFDWRLLLEVARRLYEAGGKELDQEAAWRSAVNRSYYAAFGYAMQHAVNRMSYEPRESAADHSGLRRHFQQCNKANIVRQLDDLYKWREQCDYRSEIATEEHIVKSAIQRAEQTIKGL